MADRYPIAWVDGLPVHGPYTLARRPEPGHKTTTVIFRHATLKRDCKRVIRRTYFIDERWNYVDRRRTRSLWRPDPVRGSRPPYEDANCPDCTKHLTWGEIVGQVDQHVPCDARCMAARGPSCVCSCGGENHGCAFHVDGDLM